MRFGGGNRQGMRFFATKAVASSSKANIPACQSYPLRPFHVWHPVGESDQEGRGS
jgi:hypothetical protein